MADIKATSPAVSGQPAAQPAPAANAGAAAGISGIGALIEKFLGGKKSGTRQFDIGLVNRALMVIIGVLIISFATGSSKAWKELKNLSIKEFAVGTVSKKESGFKEIATMKGVSYYIGKLSGRDIFRRQAKPDEPAAEPVFSTKMADMTANLKLVGISMSDNPDAMIEDTKLQKTFFVKMGTMIGDLRVDNITKDKVVLKYNKEFLELR